MPIELWGCGWGTSGSDERAARRPGRPKRDRAKTRAARKARRNHR